MASIIGVAVAQSFVLGFLATLIVRAWARRVGFVDRPGGHKGHDQAVALGGGIAITLALCVPVLAGTALAWWFQRDAGVSSHWLPALFQRHSAGIASKLPIVLGIVACSLALFAVGLFDDRRPLGPLPKFAAQFAVALVTAWLMGIRVIEAVHPVLSIAATVLWIVLITNAFNFLDNMDGLSAGVAVIAAAVFALTSMRAGQVFVPILAWVMVGALLGFLALNFSPASIFMGDAGSLVIGYWLSVITILTTFYDPSQGLRPLGIVAPIVVLAVPLYDVGSVVIHRIRAGDNPLKGDRRHFSHRLVARGMPPRRAVITIYLATAATALPAIALPRVDWRIAILLFVQCVSVVALIAVLEHAAPARPTERRHDETC